MPSTIVFTSALWLFAPDIYHPTLRTLFFCPITLFAATDLDYTIQYGDDIHGAYQHFLTPEGILVLASLKLDASFTFDVLVVSGDWASVCTHGNDIITIRATGITMPAKTREIFVLTRHTDGWKIAQYMLQMLPA